MLKREPTVYFCPANAVLLRGGSRPICASQSHTLLGEKVRGTAAEAPVQQRGDHTYVQFCVGFTKENAYIIPCRTDSNRPRNMGGCQATPARTQPRARDVCAGGCWDYISMDTGLCI